jgi:hypothetical protein
MTRNLPKIDDKIWRELLARVKGIKDAHVKVGFVGDGAAAPNGGSTNAELAAIHEFGAPRANIPARPFIRPTFDTRRDELVRLQTKLAKDLIAGKIDVTQAMGLLGAWGAGAIKAQVTRNGQFVPLAVATIRRKNSSKPLIDSGQMLASVSWVVVP